MSQYYYTIAALPHLQYDSEPRDVGSFLQFCRETISEKDYDVLCEVRLNSEWETARSSNDIVRLWQAWERELRIQLAKLRLERKKMEPDPRFSQVQALNFSGAAGGEFLELQNLARSILSASTPLAAEEMITKSYWEQLEGMEVSHFFDFGKLLIYYLKMLVLQKKSMFNGDSGNKRYKSIYENILNAHVSAGAETAEAK